MSVEELDVTTPREAERHLDRLGVDGPASLAEESVVRVFELDGLADGDVRTLAAAAGDAGATLARGTTEPGAAGQDVLLLGTPRALRETATVAEGESEALRSALDSVKRAVF